MPESKKPRKPMNQTPVWERPVKGPISHAAQLPPSNLKRNLLIGGGITAATGGAYYLHRRGRTKEKEKTVTASKNLVNPFEEVVVFGKAYPVVEPVPRSTTIRALVPTGSHVGHGNALKHVRNSKGGGGRATKLERYTGGHANQKVGPFGKGIDPVTKSRSISGGALNAMRRSSGDRAGVERGLAQIASLPDKGARRPIYRSGQHPWADTGKTQASTAGRSKLNFQNPGSTGRRLA